MRRLLCVLAFVAGCDGPFGPTGGTLVARCEGTRGLARCECLHAAHIDPSWNKDNNLLGREAYECLRALVPQKAEAP